jgi:hypothetical protein
MFCSAIRSGQLLVREAFHGMQNKPCIGRLLKDLQLTDEERKRTQSSWLDLGPVLPDVRQSCLGTPVGA